MANWILFDQGGVQNTLVFTHKENYEINSKSFNGKDLEKIFYTDDFKNYMIGKTTEKEMITNFIKDNNLELRVDEFVQLFKTGTVPVDGIYDIIANLSMKYNLAALINEGKEWAEYKFEATGLRSKFPIRIISGEIGIKKPDPEFYTYALKQIRTTPDKCLFIDDDKKNCAAAEAQGIKSIVFENAEQLLKELKTKGLL